MARTLTTSGDYTIDAGSNDIKLTASDVTVTGNLAVTGTTTTITTTNTSITDNTIVLNKDESGAGVTAGTAGIEIERGSVDNASVIWNETTDKFNLKVGSSFGALEALSVTTSGGITVNLPAAAVGSIVAVSDYASTAASNNITVEPNGSEKINGVNDGYTISTAGLAVTLVYADATRGCFGGGWGSSASDKIDYITIQTTGNAADFGNLTHANQARAGFANTTRGVWSGGDIGGSPGSVNTIDYITIQTTGNATDFGDLTVARQSAVGVSA